MGSTLSWCVRNGWLEPDNGQLLRATTGLKMSWLPIYSCSIECYTFLTSVFDLNPMFCHAVWLIPSKGEEGGVMLG